MKLKFHKEFMNCPTDIEIDVMPAEEGASIGIGITSDCSHYPAIIRKAIPEIEGNTLRKEIEHTVTPDEAKLLAMTIANSAGVREDIEAMTIQRFLQFVTFDILKWENKQSIEKREFYTVLSIMAQRFLKQG
jgi:hypothetical protein